MANATKIKGCPAWQSVLVVLALLVMTSSQGGEAASKPLSQILHFGELMAQAEVIAVCEVRSTHVGSARLRVIEWLKGPPEDAQRWLQANRASARLAQENGKEKAVKPAADPELDVGIDVIAPFEPPAAGTQNLYFLWERAEATAELPLRFRVAHPQCLYETAYSAEVKTELAKARTAPRRAFLRPWDAKMAARLHQQQQAEQLLKLEPGHAEKGLRIAIRFVKPSMLSPGSFDVSVGIENLLDAEQTIYDGPLPTFGVRLRRKDAPADQPLVLLAQDDEPVRGGPDADVLSLLDLNDFSGIHKRDKLIKTLHFGVREHPELAKLQGDFLASAFYYSTQDGKGVEDLPGVPWVGTLVSDEAPLTLAPAAKP